MATIEPPSRAAIRKQRQEEIEMEQRAEEAEALRMTWEQQQLLWHSFNSVQFEYADLDGLLWTGTRLATEAPEPHPALGSKRKRELAPRYASQNDVPLQYEPRPHHRQILSAIGAPPLASKHYFDESLILQKRRTVEEFVGGTIRAPFKSTTTNAQHGSIPFAHAPRPPFKSSLSSNDARQPRDEEWDESELKTPCPSPRLHT